MSPVTSVDPALREELAELAGAMCKVIEAHQPRTSRHLAIVRDRGLVATDRQGNNVVYLLRHLPRQVMTDEVSR